jgi:predicted PurR-regulated permease PerM
MPTVVGTIYGLAGGFMKLVLGFVFSIYILLDKKRIKLMLRRLLDALFSKKLSAKINGYVELCAVTFKSFISGQVVESLLLGGLCFIGMAVIGLPHASVISVLIGVTGIIPVLGAYIGAIPSALLLLLENPVQALVFLVFLIALQQFENAVIYPKVVGDAIGIDGLFVFIGVTLGAGLGGVMGLLVGVPLVAVVYAAVGRMIRDKERRRDEDGGRPRDKSQFAPK